MGLTPQDLMLIGGLNSDGVQGFQAQVALAKTSIRAVWPEHFKGARVDNFEKGSALARDWMTARRATGTARRGIRLRQRREDGLMTVLRPTGAELREEQVENLRDAVRRRQAVDDMLAREAAGESPQARP